MAKEDLTIANFEFYYSDGSRNVEVSYGAGTFIGNEVDSSFWTLAGSGTVTPLCEENPAKLSCIGVLPSPFAINVAAGDRVAIKVRVIGGLFRITAIDEDLGQVSEENSHLSMYTGRIGDSFGSPYSWSDMKIYGQMLYSLGLATPAPTPVGGPPCADSEGLVTITINGKPKSKTCKLWSKKKCDKPGVEEACPVSCNACPAVPTESPTPAPTPVGDLPCTDSEGLVTITVKGKPKSKTCAVWSKKNCGKPEVEEACPVSCDACPTVPTDSPTPAPIPTGGPPCADKVGPITITINGKPKSKTCARWSKNKCGKPAIVESCPVSCDACD